MRPRHERNPARPQREYTISLELQRTIQAALSRFTTPALEAISQFLESIQWHHSVAPICTASVRAHLITFFDACKCPSPSSKIKNLQNGDAAYRFDKVPRSNDKFYFVMMNSNKIEGLLSQILKFIDQKNAERQLQVTLKYQERLRAQTTEHLALTIATKQEADALEFAARKEKILFDGQLESLLQPLRTNQNISTRYEYSTNQENDLLGKVLALNSELILSQTACVVELNSKDPTRVTIRWSRKIAEMRNIQEELATLKRILESLR